MDFKSYEAGKAMARATQSFNNLYNAAMVPMLQKKIEARDKTISKLHSYMAFIFLINLITFSMMLYTRLH